MVVLPRANYWIKLFSVAKVVDTTVPGHSNGQEHEGVTIWEPASATEYLCSRMSPTKRRPHLFDDPMERAFRGHGFKLRQHSFHLLQRKSAFSVRLSISWNKLPTEIINVPTVETFQRLLDTAWPFLFPPFPWLPCSLNLHLTWFETLNSATIFDQYIKLEKNNERSISMRFSKICSSTFLHKQT